MFYIGNKIKIKIRLDNCLEDIRGMSGLRSPHVINACDIVRSEQSAFAGPVTSFLANAPQTAALLIILEVDFVITTFNQLGISNEGGYLLSIFHIISFPSSCPPKLIK